MAEGLSVTSTEPKPLLLDGFPVQTKVVTLAEGYTALAGDILALTTTGDVSNAIPQGSLVGNGTVTGTITKGGKCESGSYTLTCITTAANGGMFAVVAPSGAVVGFAKVGTLFVSDHISGFTINDGSTDFALGDRFAVTVDGGNGKAILLDGDIPHSICGILSADVSSVDGEVLVTVYTSGVFVRQGLRGYDESLEEPLRHLNIFVKEQA